MLTQVEIPGLLCTALLVLGGLSLGVWHWLSWTKIAETPAEATPTRWGQCRRRLQVAGLIAFEGVLLCLGDTVLPILQRQQSISEVRMALLWTIDVLVMLLAAICLVLVAMSDVVTSISQSRMERLRSRQQERVLCEEIERYRELHGDDESPSSRSR